MKNINEIVVQCNTRIEQDLVLDIFYSYGYTKGVEYGSSLFYFIASSHFTHDLVFIFNSLDQMKSVIGPRETITFQDFITIY